jgi:uncharacterized flavoprotein (TIGR03862 family)
MTEQRPSSSSVRPFALVIGGGPAGLMAADMLSAGGHAVTVVDQMPSPGRKLLMAGIGGLNLTHSEPIDRFLERYGSARTRLEPSLRAFTPTALRQWAERLGEPTFIGSSGRVFPASFKASPLLRAWLRHLVARNVTFRLRTRWTGWPAAGQFSFTDATGAPFSLRPACTIFALGGASWPKLGADGGWVSLFRSAGIPLAPLVPANCGFKIGWSDVFRDRFAGSPLKRIRLSHEGQTVRGELAITAQGLEGGAIYALGKPIRRAIERGGRTTLMLDMRPDLDAAALAARLDRHVPGQSLANRLRKAAGLSPVASNLLREASAKLPSDAIGLAALIKALPLELIGVAPMERAISTAGGVSWQALDATFMLHSHPGVFTVGEMVDWEAPTGGYLLQACLAMGASAGKAASHLLGSA